MAHLYMPQITFAAHLFMLLQTAATLQPWNCCWQEVAACALTVSHGKACPTQHTTSETQIVKHRAW